MEKGRIPADALPRLQQELDSPNGVLTLTPFDRVVAETMQSIPRTQVPDFPDRIIAATAWHLGVPLVSRDARIQASGMATIW
jgi:predicted nucleic acid-binding protein